MTLLNLPVSASPAVIGPVVGVALVKGSDILRAKTLIHSLGDRRFTTPGVQFSGPGHSL